MLLTLLAHRGFWLSREEQNTLAAFERAFRRGCGLETDLRDQDGAIVIAHDCPRGPQLRLEQVLELHRDLAPDAMLALNIKADGLQKPLKAALETFGVRRYFVFDASIPDLLGYSHAGLRFFTRQSEYEQPPGLLRRADGVWLDGFERDWIGWGTLAGHWACGRAMALVSPELHRRPHLAQWRRTRALLRIAPGLGKSLYLCTDFIDEAERFFA